jgi:hypothetical protein
MNPKSDRTQLEERIAPSKGGNTTKFTTTQGGNRSAD